jgi:hypothetical protein
LHRDGIADGFHAIKKRAGEPARCKVLPVLIFELHRLRLRHLVRARLIGRRVGLGGGVAHHVVGQQPRFHFVAAHVGQHIAVDFHARLQHLAAALDHFGAVLGIVDHVFFVPIEVVLAQHRPHAFAPAASGLEVTSNVWFIHRCGEDGRGKINFQGSK